MATAQQASTVPPGFSRGQLISIWVGVGEGFTKEMLQGGDSKYEIVRTNNADQQERSMFPRGPGAHPQRLGHGKVPGPRKMRWGSRDAQGGEGRRVLLRAGAAQFSNPRLGCAAVSVPTAHSPRWGECRAHAGTGSAPSLWEQISFHFQNSLSQLRLFSLDVATKPPALP